MLVLNTSLFCSEIIFGMHCIQLSWMFSNFRAIFTVWIIHDSVSSFSLLQHWNWSNVVFWRSENLKNRWVIKPRIWEMTR